jgi:hypothetical protein
MGLGEGAGGGADFGGQIQDIAWTRKQFTYVDSSAREKEEA